VLEEREESARLRAPDHEPDADGSEIGELAVAWPDDSRPGRAVEPGGWDFEWLSVFGLNPGYFWLEHSHGVAFLLPLWLRN
jgi:hypothetical protein